MNKWIGTGRLTVDPELKNISSGKSVCNFTIAVERRFKIEGQPSADFINCIAWGKTGEFISKYFTKGKSIGIDGAIQTRSWEDQEKKKHYATEINVDNAEFCGDKPNNDKIADNKSNNDKVANNKPVKNTVSKSKNTDALYEGENDSEDDLPF